MKTALVALGANLGERKNALDSALKLLASEAEINLTKVSSYHETEPVGGPAGQPPFLNACARLETELSPEILLDKLLAIETQLGRSRHQRWDARSIDLDLLLVEEIIVKSAVLELPHPRLAYRPFVLAPACEIAGEMVHPQVGWKLEQILAYIRSGPVYVAVTGEAEHRTELCRAAAEQCGAILVEREGIEHRQMLKAGKNPRGFISDFWQGELDLDIVSDDIPLPRLLVWLEPASSSADSEALRKQVENQYQGPRLNLSADDPRAVEEIAAAVTALRS